MKVEIMSLTENSERIQEMDTMATVTGIGKLLNA